MDTEFYKYKVLLILSDAEKPVKRSVLIRAAMHHVPGDESDMLLDFMERTGLITMKIVRPLRGAGRPPSYVEITAEGKSTLKDIKKERKLWQT